MTTPGVLTETSNFSIPVSSPVHKGKVRSVYWLSDTDSQALCERRGYELPDGETLGIMIISDRLSAFECLWTAEGEMGGVPLKGASLNAIALHWFEAFSKAGIAEHHIVETPHPLLWVIRRAKPLMFEGIVRQYITGSLWRAYDRGKRVVCGVELAEGLTKNQRLPSLLFTPTTKGTLYGLEGILEDEDTAVSREQILRYSKAFNLASSEDLDAVVSILERAVALMEGQLAAAGQIFVDTKFEFGYFREKDGSLKLRLMDEVGTPDSSRFWDAAAFKEGHVLEVTKEAFRGYLLEHLDRDILTRSERFAERKVLAAEYRVPMDAWMEVSGIYAGIAEQITGQAITGIERPREELLETLSSLQLLR